MFKFALQAVLMSVVMNNFISGRKSKQQPEAPLGDGAAPVQGGKEIARKSAFRNLYGKVEECDLYVHFSPVISELKLGDLLNETTANAKGLQLLWQRRVWYQADAETLSINVSVGPLTEAQLRGENSPVLRATMIRVPPDGAKPGPEEVITNSLPLVAKLRELNAQAGAESLFGPEEQQVQKPSLSSPKLPYFKKHLEIRPVHDHTVHSSKSLSQGLFRKMRPLPKHGVYQPYLWISDFWLLEKDYLPLNETLIGQRLNLTLSYSVAPMWVWQVQTQMADKWTEQGEWGITDSQRDSFMMKRLMIDTNPYLLGFSATFMMLHMVFSMLAFKNDIQFWRKNESMKGLSARTMIVSFVCQFITTLYLLDSQETSKMILFNIVLEMSLAFWKLRKAVQVTFDLTFPFVHIGGQTGYEEEGTSQYDREAVTYVGAIIAPIFVGFSIRSLLYEKHRGWYSFIVGSAAGGVYTFGFIMMTPQLYINYKLKSVEHLPWRALTYKAMNTFVDDVAALLIDMPMMHRLSCFRDDVIFFIYIFQRWKYRVDKSRPTIYGSPEDEVPGTPAAVEDAAPDAVAQIAADDPSVGANVAAAAVDAPDAPESVPGSCPTSNETAGTS